MKEKQKYYKESSRPGSVSRIFKIYQQDQLNFEGKLPKYIKPEIQINKNKLK